MVDDMIYNNVQQQIRDEYYKTGNVWAECPRGCGKTSLIINVAKSSKKMFDELKKVGFTDEQAIMILCSKSNK